MERSREERLIRSSPQRVNTTVLQEYEQRGLHNSSIALHVQSHLHQVHNNSDYYAMKRGIRSQIRRMQGLAFDGYYLPQEERETLLKEVETRDVKNGNESGVYHILRETLQKMETVIATEEQKWKHVQEIMGYGPEQLRFHQDADAVIEFSSKLRGRILMFGSARKDAATKEYDATRWLTQTIVEGTMREDGHTEHILTGAGPGIMEAANEGAMRARLNLLTKYGGLTPRKRSEKQQRIVENLRSTVVSAGLRIQLPFEAGWNPYLQHNLTIKTFPARKLGLNSTASGRSVADKKGVNVEHGRYPAIFVNDAFGFGTQDELWEALCAEQCGKMPNIPIIIMGKDIRSAVKANLDIMLTSGTIDPKDVNYVISTNNEREGIEAYLDHHKINPSDEMRKAITDRQPTLV